MGKRIFMGLCLVILAGAGMSWAQGCFWDDATFFTSKTVKPNVFLLLDRSGSMCWRPQDTGYPCAANYSTACDAPFNGTGQYGSSSKIHQATQALFSVLDADSNGTVEDADSTALAVRIGYGHFYDSNGEGDGEYIPYNNDTIGTRYTKLWADARNEGTCGGTPLNQSLWLSKELVRTTHVREGQLWNCRKSFVILITDGADTWGCNGSGSGGSPQQRRAGVNVAYTSFKNDSIPVFVIGFPDLSDPNQANTLNWMAYCGGTRTAGPYSGDTTAYVPQNTGNTYQTCDNTGADPGTRTLRGYAYFASNLGELQAALKAIFKQVQQSKGSTYSPPSVPANFTLASMLLVNNFDAKTYPVRWRGHLGAFEFNNGDLPVKTGGGLDSGQLRWDAGNLLRKRNIASDPRTLYTAFKNPTGYSLVQLNDTAKNGGQVKPESLGFAGNLKRDSLIKMVNYMYYDSTSGNAKFGWLGDPFHAGPVDVGYPNPYFSNDTLYSDFVFNMHNPTVRPRRVYLQTNDGMLHVFKADSSSLDSNQQGGRELYGLVPAHVHTWLRDMLYGHDYNLDGPMISTHVLVPGLTQPGQTKWQDWRTILVGADRTGGRNYYAVDITNPTKPVGSDFLKYLWECGPTTTDNIGIANGDTAMGFTFGMATICRVWDSTAAPYKRYVAFLPGGFDCNAARRGNFVLAVDAYTGQLIKKIPLGNYGVAAPVRAVDLNYDGFVDRLYVGDMNGDVWRIILNNRAFRAQWHRKKLFQAPIAPALNKPIYGQVSVAADFKNTLYIMWGTGDRNHPTDATYQNQTAFFAVQDYDTTVHGSGTYVIGDLTNVNNNGSSCYSSNIFGWYYTLYQNANTFLEVYTNPVTVSDTVRALAWNPAGGGNACNAAGSGNDTLVSFLYTCGYLPGKRSAGTGIPPYQLGWGVDRQGNVTTLLPDLTKMVLGTLSRGKFIRVWREIY